MTAEDRKEAAAAFSITEDERKAAIEDVRDWGRRRAIDKCLKENDIDIILGPADSEIDGFYTAAGYPMACLPLSYSSFNERPFGVCAIAGQYQEGQLIQFMSAWEHAGFNKYRLLPTWLGGDPAVKSDTAKDEL
ncbi:amidase signature domain protein [Diplogelasinospora grovesii]|uniref:Amidase signature domain protein n=1 Tax=Diplogelasinospora grovesii TaxID=303347 RepID=A0AAN6N1G9_9PEZI|nr:amidase signature domain protein [Diplogelasinospora grovesii]